MKFYRFLIIIALIFSILTPKIEVFANADINEIVEDEYNKITQYKNKLNFFKSSKQLFLQKQEEETVKETLDKKMWLLSTSYYKSSPNINSTNIDELDKNTEVFAEELLNNNYIKFKYDDEYYYIESDKLTDEEPKKPQRATVTPQQASQQVQYDGSIELQYSAPYNISSGHLTKSGGIYDYNGHRETYYDEKVLPGGGLRIPGRHVAEDGTIRDEEGYICVAADPSFMPYGSTLVTSLGPAKVYDSGCNYGIIDIYVNW